MGTPVNVLTFGTTTSTVVTVSGGAASVACRLTGASSSTNADPRSLLHTQRPVASRATRYFLRPLASISATPSNTSLASWSLVSLRSWLMPSPNVSLIWMESFSLPPASDTCALNTTVGPLRLSSRMRKMKRPPSALPCASATGAPSTVGSAVAVPDAVAAGVGVPVGDGVLAACWSSSPPPQPARSASGTASARSRPMRTRVTPPRRL
jgi:hypothetical protein